MSDVVFVLRVVSVFELAIAVVVAVELQMSPGLGQFLLAMLLFGSRLMFHQCDWWLAAYHQSLERHLLLLIVLGIA